MRALYWLFVNGEDRPQGVSLPREPAVWFYVCASAVWGLGCLAFGQRVLFRQESESSIIGLIKVVAIVAVMALPTVIVTLRETDRAGQRYTFNHFLACAMFGLLGAGVLGLVLELALSFSGVHSFLGIPINNWE